MVRVGRVGPQGQEEEQAAEHVFPLGDPGHRLGPQGMQPEEDGHQQARPQGGSHPPQGHEEHEHVDGVDEDAREVVAPGMLLKAFRAEDLAVEHVREPGQRMPVVVFQAREGPGDRVPSQALVDVFVVIDVAVVVKIDEAEILVQGRPEGQDGAQEQHQRKRRPASRGSVPRTRRRPVSRERPGPDDFCPCGRAGAATRRGSARVPSSRMCRVCVFAPWG